MPDKDRISYDFEEDVSLTRLKEKSDRRFQTGWRKASDPRQIEIRFPNGRSTVRYSQVFLKAEPLDGGARRARRCLSAESARRSVPWHNFRACDHWVQVCAAERDLMESLVGFVRGAERADDAMILIATPEHRQVLTRILVAEGIDVNAAVAEGRLFLLDAEATLARFMVGSWPDPRRFEAVIGGAVARARAGGRRVRAFGEMVALLWQRGQHEAMMQLEQLWHVFCQREDLALFCAYPRGGFSEENFAQLHAICCAHTRVVG